MVRPATHHSAPTVPRLFPDRTIVCVGSGPSLTVEDVAFVRGKAPVIAINTSYQLAPWADVLWASDAKWWNWHKGAPTFSGLKYCLEPEAKKWLGVQVLRNYGSSGLSVSPKGVKNGRNSGFAAINCAFLLGARRVVLLGYDLGPGQNGREHWHADHPNKSRSPYRLFLHHFPSLVEPLTQRGVEVINCSRTTALTCFPRMPIAVALSTTRDRLQDSPAPVGFAEVYA